MKKLKIYDKQNAFRCKKCKKRTHHHYKKPYTSEKQIIICSNCGLETTKERPLMIGDSLNILKSVKKGGKSN